MGVSSLSKIESDRYMAANSFFTPTENEAASQFLREGYIIFPLEEIHQLDALKTSFYETSREFIQEFSNLSEEQFFSQTHKLVSVSNLNEFRLKLINYIGQNAAIRPTIYSLAKKYLHWIVGNELAMQRNCNLSIQFPEDDSSLLPVHSDVWSGNSPYEVVFWLPLVNCYRTKSMFILPRTASEKVYKNFKSYSNLSAEGFYQAIKDHLEWLEVPYGYGAIFAHALPHGNRVNEEPETRWTINVRFKSLLSPYGSKELGESFLPITMRPATRIGYSYIKPEC